MGNSGRRYIGMTRVEAAMEDGVFVDGDGKPVVRRFYNWAPCEFSGDCLVEESRLGTLLIKNQKYCLDNPSIEKCWMHQLLEF